MIVKLLLNRNDSIINDDNNNVIDWEFTKWLCNNYITIGTKDDSSSLLLRCKINFLIYYDIALRVCKTGNYCHIIITLVSIVVIITIIIFTLLIIRDLKLFKSVHTSCKITKRKTRFTDFFKFFIRQLHLI